MNLYGNDMDESTHPFESGPRLDRSPRAARARFHRPRGARGARARAARERKLVGLVLEDRGVLRSHQKVIVPAVGEGEVTSGTFSPTLERSIGLARVPARTGGAVQVEVRGRLLTARVVQAAVRASRRVTDSG